MPHTDPAFSAVLALPPCRFGIQEKDGFAEALYFLPPEYPLQAPTSLLAEDFSNQLKTYLDKPTTVFDVPLHPQGTQFQQRVWAAISAIPSGKVRRYKEIAVELGSVPRAVGQACGANPFPLVIPCHRVVSTHNLGGFANHSDGWLIETKRWLLWHEGFLI
ncbi:MAG: methylated-DNA--[protein]-cysteine S-methyltransferase [Betaproteobacteria bacterium]|nr:methylated-DNA--[protein]-cysteine S-methyltransferase [Betaproteobacteria bacterium]